MQQYEDRGIYNLGVYKKVSLFSEDVCATFPAGEQRHPRGGLKKITS